MICKPGFHHRHYAQRLVNAAEVAISEVQRTCGFQVVQLFAEGVCQPRESANRHSHCEVLPFYVRSAHVFGIRISLANLGYDLHDWGWGVPRSGVMLPIITVQLYDLPEVNIRSKMLFYGVDVKAEAVSRLAARDSLGGAPDRQQKHS